MATTVNHNYQPPSLVAIPLPGGSVSIDLVNSGGVSQGTTTADKFGNWRQSFSVIGDTYTVKFTGNFYPIGRGRTSVHIRPITAQNVTIIVPIDVPEELRGEQGETGSQGETGPQGEAGPQGEEGDSGDQGTKGDTGAAGGIGLLPDTDDSNQLTVAWDENSTTNRTLNFKGLIGSDRTITLSGSPSLGDWFNQSVKSSDTPIFDGFTSSGNIDLRDNDIHKVETITFGAELDNGNSGLLATINWRNNQKQAITLSANCTITFTAPLGVGNFMLRAINFGAFTPTWPATVLWSGGTEPTWTASGTDIIGFYYNGTNYYGAANTDFG